VSAVKEATLLDCALSLKQLVVDAKKRGDLSDDTAQQVFSGISRVTHALEGTLTPYWQQVRELPAYTDWPNERHPCPKCGDTKPRFRKWRRGTAHAPERVEHCCFCDYSIFTMPLDRSEEGE
jgi:hypothetical protein